MLPDGMLGFTFIIFALVYTFYIFDVPITNYRKRGDGLRSDPSIHLPLLSLSILLVAGLLPESYDGYPDSTLAPFFVFPILSLLIAAFDSRITPDGLALVCYQLSVHPATPQSSRRYSLTKSYAPGWTPGYGVAEWNRRPTRSMIAYALKQYRASLPSRCVPDTLGWRAWQYDATRRLLMSPHQETPWPTSSLQASHWTDDQAVRGKAGIHARRTPRNWRTATWSDHGEQEGPIPKPLLVHGLVERYGRYVIGTTGWRAEHVVVRGLVAPNIEIMIALIERYPDVEVVLAPSQEDSKPRHRRSLKQWLCTCFGKEA